MSDFMRALRCVAVTGMQSARSACSTNSHASSIEMQMGCLGILAELVMSQLETQRREREARAETAAHDRYSSLVTFGSDAPPPAVLSLSDDGTVVYANPQARQFTGLAQGEPVGEADWPQAVIDAEEINSQWAEWCHGPASDNAFTLAIPTTDAGALLLHAQKDVDCRWFHSWLHRDHPRSTRHGRVRKSDASSPKAREPRRLGRGNRS